MSHSRVAGHLGASARGDGASQDGVDNSFALYERGAEFWMAYGSSKEGGYGADIPVIRRAQSGYGGDAGCACGAPALGKVGSVAGDVTITRPGAGAYRISAGDCVFASDLIETGPDGRLAIAFVDGSEFRLGGGAALALEELFGAETARGAALLRILKGVFAFVTGRAALGRFAIDTPVGRIQASAPAIGIGSLTFGALTLGLIHDLKAASADIGLIDDGTIDYKDLKHGVFEILTKEAHPRIIVVDDPSVTIELRPRGGGTVGVDEVANTPAQMAQLQSAFQGAYSTFTQGQQDPFIQQLEQGAPNDHANAQPQSAPGSVGSSTAASDLDSGGQGLGQIGGTQLASNAGGAGPLGVLPIVAPVIAGTTTTSTTLPPIGSTGTETVEWIGASGGNWDAAGNWLGGIVPGAGTTVEISTPVTVRLSSAESISGLDIGAGATLDIETGGALTIAGTINNAGTIILDDPPVNIPAGQTLTASGGGGITMLGATAVNEIIGLGPGATFINQNNTITGAGLIGVGDGNLTFQNDGTIDANIGSTPGQPIEAIVINTGNQTTNYGLFEATAGGTLTIDDPLANYGKLAANGGTVDVAAAVTGSGSASVSGGGTFEIGAADAQAFAFAGADAGTLKLDAGSDFTGNVTLAAGAIIDLVGTIVTSAEIDGATLVINGAPETFTIAGLPTGDTFAFKSDGAGGSDLAVLPQILNVSTSLVSGTENSAIALNVTEALSGGATLTSFTLSGIPNGATLSNSNGDTLTVSNGSITFTAAEIVDGYLNGLSIKLATSESFTLSVLAMATDSNGYEYTVPATENVIVTNSTVDTWQGAANGAWSTDGNWSDFAPPSAGQEAVIKSGATPHVTANATVDDVLLQNAGTITVAPSGTFTLDGGTAVSGDGAIALDAGATLTLDDVTLESGVVQFSRAGKLQLEGTITGQVTASSTGSAPITIAGSGDVTASASGADGIDATSAGGDISITPSGSVTGASTAIEAVQDGGGSITISVGAGIAVTGTAGYGIEAVALGPGSISVSTASHATIDSAASGILADNAYDPTNLDPAVPSTSSINVNAAGTINSGTGAAPDGTPPAGILAGYDMDDTFEPNVAGNVTVTSTANITAQAGDGIRAYNFGTGAVTVHDNGGTITTDGDPIAGQATAENGFGNGIYALTAGGTISVTMAAGATINSAASGIFASDTTDNAATGQITVDAAGTIDSGTILTPNGDVPAGILAGYNSNNQIEPNVAGSVSVTLEGTGDITAAAGDGIRAYNFGTGDVTVTTKADSSISAPAIGIAAYALDGGNITISNAATVTGSDGIGLLAEATGGSGHSTVSITNSGDVSGTGTLAYDQSTDLFTDPVVGIITADGTATLTNESGGTIAAPSPAGLAIAEFGGAITINNSGTIIGIVALGNDATFDNEAATATTTAGIWNISGANYFGTGSVINNAGTINSSGTTTIGATFNNTGIVNIEGGSLDLTASGTDSDAKYQGAGTLEFRDTHTFDDVTLTGENGTLTIDNYGTLKFLTNDSSVNFADLTNETPSDVLKIDDVRVTFDDTTVSGGAITETGTEAQINIDANNSATFENTTLTLSSSTAIGGSVLVDGTLTLDSNITIDGSGTFTIGDSGTLVFDGPVSDTGVTADFASATATLALGDPGDFKAILAGLKVGDTIDLTDINSADIASVTINQGATGGTVVVQENAGGDDAQFTFNYTGNLSGDQFTWTADNDGSGTGTDLTLESISPDYVWNAVAGDWSAAGNWQENGGSATAPPGSNDNVTIGGTNNEFAVVTGTGDAASLTISGFTVLAGDFSTGQLSVLFSGAYSYDALILEPGGTLTAASLTTNESFIALNGATLDVTGNVSDNAYGTEYQIQGGTFTVGGTFVSNEDFLSADASYNGVTYTGSTVEFAELNATDGISINVDDYSSVEIGTGTAAAGIIEIDIATTATGTFQAPNGIVVNASLTVAAGGELELVGALYGTGTVQIGQDAELYLSSGDDDPPTINFQGGDGALVVGYGVLDDCNALGSPITNFNASDVIDFYGTATCAKYCAADGVLTLFDDGDAVAYFTIGSGYTGDKFEVVSLPYGDTQISILQTGGSFTVDQTPGDQFTWGAAVSGSWGDAGNWTGGSADYVPGSGDDVTIDSKNQWATSVITGSGCAATLTIDTSTILEGQFKTGSLTDNAYELTISCGDCLKVTGDASISSNFTLDGTLTVGGTLSNDSYNFYIAGGTATVGNLVSSDSYLTVDNGSFLVTGNVSDGLEYGNTTYYIYDGTFTVDGTFTAANDSIEAYNGSTVTLGGLSGSVYLYADSTSTIEIDSSNDATGAITIGAIDLTVSGYFTAQSIILDDTTIAVPNGGSLTLDGEMSGSGTINIGAGAELIVENTFGDPVVPNVLTIDFTGNNAVLDIDPSALESGQFVPLIHGFGATDAIDFNGTVSGVSYSGSTLTIDYGDGQVATLDIGSGYSGTFCAFAISSDVSQISFYTGGDTDTAPAGTASTDDYTWQAVAGSWDNASNWNDTTAGQVPANLAPGSHDNVTILASGYEAAVVTGTGDSASLTIAGTTVLDGEFCTGSLTDNAALTVSGGDCLKVTGNASISTSLTLDGSLTVDGTVSAYGYNFSVDGGTASVGTLVSYNGNYFSIDDGGSLTVTGNASDADQAANYSISGYSSAFTVEGAFTSTNDSITASNYGTAELGSLAVTSGAVVYLTVEDSSSKIEVGTSEGAAGAITIDADSTVAGTFQAPSIVVESGTTLSVAAYNYLGLDGALSGSGTIDVNTGAELYIQNFDDLPVPGTEPTIDFTGHDAVLYIDPTALTDSGDFAPLIEGLNATDAIDFNGTVTSVTVGGYSGGDSTLTLYDGHTVVATLILQGDYASDTFTAALIDGGQETQIVDPPGTGTSSSNSGSVPPGSASAVASSSAPGGSVSIGGPGNDTFVFHPDMGAETITNFNAQTDSIDLDGFSNIHTTQQLASLITTGDNAGDAVIHLDPHDSITILGLTAAQLQAHLTSLVHLH